MAVEVGTITEGRAAQNQKLRCCNKNNAEKIQRRAGNLNRRDRAPRRLARRRTGRISQARREAAGGEMQRDVDAEQMLGYSVVLGIGLSSGSPIKQVYKYCCSLGRQAGAGAGAGKQGSWEQGTAGGEAVR